MAFLTNFANGNTAFVAKKYNWKSNFVMCLIMRPLLALATLGDTTQIEMILFESHCPMWQGL
jgi:hypothetical protein